MAANATFLVSRDKDLLDLMNDPDFRGRFPDLSILDPVAFLQEIRKRQLEKDAEAAAEETPSEGEGP